MPRMTMTIIRAAAPAALLCLLPAAAPAQTLENPPSFGPAQIAGVRAHARILISARQTHTNIQDADRSCRQHQVLITD